MPGRTRRVRLLAVAVCIATVYFLYYNNGVERAAEYIKPKNAVGGGAVLRQPEDIEPLPPGPDARPAQEPIAEPYPDPTSKAVEEAVPKTALAQKEHEPQPTTSVSEATSPSALEAETTAAPPKTPPPALPSNDGAADEEYETPTLEHLEYDEDGQPVYSYPPIHWSKLPEQYPVTSTVQLPSGSPRPIPLIQKRGGTADRERLAAVKDACKHAWKGYRQFGWDSDEVTPVSGTGKDSFNGWGATLVDSLDTLWIMGMKEEFEDAVNRTSFIDFTTSPRNDIPMFEVTIRYLGGLIAAYDVSGQKYRVLLDKAVELAEILYSAFDTPNRMPETYYYWKPTFATNVHRSGSRVVLAELGTLSLEFTRLAQLTREPKYYDAIARITDAFEEWQNLTRLPGMWPTVVDSSGCAKPVSLPPSRSFNQVPVPGGDSYMLSSEPVQVGADVIKKAEEALDKQKAEKDILDAADNNVANPKVDVGTSSELRFSFQRDELNEAFADNTKRKRQLDVGDLVDSRVNPNPTDNSSVIPSGHTNLQNPGESSVQQGYQTPTELEEPECVPQGFRSPSMNALEKYTLGGESDSMYEYLPKEYLLLGGQLDQYKDMYLKSMEPWIQKGLFRPMTPDNLDVLVSGEVTVQKNYTTNKFYETYHAKGEHLTCFAGGMFAMGGKIFNVPEHVEIGKKITDGCVWTYNATTSGIMPESFTVAVCEDKDNCVYNETLYWEQLDPYHTSRDEQREQYIKDYGEEALNNYDPSMADVDAHSGAGDTLGGGTFGAQTVPHHPKPANLVYDDVTNEWHGHSKRDLHNEAVEEVDDPALPRPVATPAPSPTKTTTSTTDHDEGEHDIFPPGYDKSADTDYTTPVSTAPIYPVYTPPPPPTHSDYVKQKIKDERLPPGIVRYDSRKYILRPEAIESVFYMYRITGEQYWRDMGWKMFTAVDRATRAEFGHSALDDVSKLHPEHMDGMESFWIAETLKYFYLLFDEPDKWSLDDWVLNTEAHFFKRPENPIEK